jgi:hypothetical protein
VLLFLGGPRLLGLLELELAVVHDADHRRARSRCYFDEVEAVRIGLRERRLEIHDPELRAIGPDDAHWADADLTVDPHAFGGVLNVPVPLLSEQKMRTPMSESASHGRPPRWAFGAGFENSYSTPR